MCFTKYEPPSSTTLNITYGPMLSFTRKSLLSISRVRYGIPFTINGASVYTSNKLVPSVVESGRIVIIAFCTFVMPWVLFLIYSGRFELNSSQSDWTLASAPTEIAANFDFSWILTSNIVVRVINFKIVMAFFIFEGAIVSLFYNVFFIYNKTQKGERAICYL